MDPARQSIVDALRRAIQSESDGHHFYRMAASSTSDQQGRQVFEALAGDELEHIRFLRAQHQSLLETGLPDEKVRLGAPAVVTGSIFSADLVARAKDAHYEMSALSIGIQLELGAVGFYRAQAEAAQHPTVRAFFQELAAWEQGHYNLLLQQQAALKDDYWAAAGFSPF